MHSWRIRLNLANYIDWLRRWLGPVFSPERECPARLLFSYEHSIEPNVDDAHAGGKILNRAGNAPSKSIASFNMKGNLNLFTRLERDLARFRSYHQVG